MERIPEGRILSQNNYGDSYKDIVESFNLDLSKNYGAIQTTRMKLVTDEDDEVEIDNAPAGFAFYNGNYYAIAGGYAFVGGGAISDSFNPVLVTNSPDNELTVRDSDIEIFNNCMYISGSNEVFKLSGSTWSKPITSGLADGVPHLLKAYTDRLYITDEYYKVHSISQADALSTSGSFTLDLDLGNDWIISMLEAGQNSLWIGLINSNSGRGLMYEWDGATENTPIRRIELEAGVVAGTVLDNIPMFVDSRGRIMEFNGSGFIERDRFFFKDQFYMYNASANGNDRFIHANGICTTDYGTILIAMQNEQDVSFGNEDTVPSGVYEYMPGVGLYHKHSISDSPKADLTFTDYGQQRVNRMGAIFFSRARGVTDDPNGTILVGADVYTAYTDILNNTAKAGIYIDDTIKTTPTMGYFVSRKFYSDTVEEAWNKTYAIYSKFKNATDKIVVKYRVTEKNSMSANCTWLNANQFTTTDDVSDFAAGEEVVILTGTGAGSSMEITQIDASASTYTVTVKDNPFNATGGFAARFENFKVAGTISNNKQSQEVTLQQATGTFVQMKVEMYFTGNQELHKVHIMNKKTIK